MSGGQLLAGITLVACVLALLHMALPAPRQRRIEAWWRTRRDRMRQAWLALRHGRRRRATAAGEAAAAIRRAQERAARAARSERPGKPH